MKIKITLKDTDTLRDAITESVETEVETLKLDDEEAEVVKEKRVEKYMNIAEDWFEYGEYVTLELDTEAKTMVVVPRG